MVRISFREEKDEDKSKDKNVKKIRVSFDFEKMEKLMDDLMKDMLVGESGEGKPAKPLVMGFQMRFDDQGQPVIESIGNVKPSEKELKVQPREPLVDVIKGKQDITVTAELPGVKKKDILVEVGRHHIEIKVERPSFFKRIEFEEELEPKVYRSSLNNGIFELQVKRK